eukprot:gene126-biopygen136
MPDRTTPDWQCPALASALRLHGLLLGSGRGTSIRTKLDYLVMITGPGVLIEDRMRGRKRGSTTLTGMNSSHFRWD